MVTVALAASSAGLLLLVATLCRTIRQSHTVSNVLVLVLSAVGGSMVPRFLMPPWLQQAGGRAAQVDALDRYGAEIGLAFQIVDDILDVQGTTEDIGKTAGKDAALKKVPYATMYGTERSAEMARAAVGRARRTLCDAELPDDRLMAIARWVVERSC
ncbi:MAG: polyprenyl synthetase family protein [Vicinamibacterales bacterium]